MENKDRTYSLNELAMMTGFTTRTLRTYLDKGLLRGEKPSGVWQFTAEEVDRFFQEPFVKEGLRIKRNSAVFDHLAGRDLKQERSCVILDIPATAIRGGQISAFFCERMKEASGLNFSYLWDKGLCRVILTGNAEPIAQIMRAYEEWKRDEE